jgi:maltose phosphorylase
MVTMNGEECQRWEITLKKFIEMGLFAIYITTDTRVTIAISLKRFEVLIAIARFWHQRATFLTQQNQYVILGVTGPNENNVKQFFTPIILPNGV